MVGGERGLREVRSSEMREEEEQRRKRRQTGQLAVYVLAC